MKTLGLITFTLVVGLLGFISLVPTSTLQFGAVGATEMPTWLRYLFAFALVLIGVFLGSVYRNAVALRDQNQNYIPSYKLMLGRVFRSIDFVLSLAGAPIVFALILQQAPNVTLVGLAMIAMQNGFVSPIIIGSVTPTVSSNLGDSS